MLLTIRNLLFVVAACVGCVRSRPQVPLDAALSTAPPSLSAESDEAGPQRAAPSEVTIAAVGDLMLGTSYPPGSPLPPSDGARMFEEVAPILRAADLAFGNLEGPLVDEELAPVCTPGGIAERSKGTPGGRACWSFRMPTRFGPALRDAGFDVLSISNNHAFDFGGKGRASTRSVLERMGIAYAGMPATFARVSVHGTRVAVLAFATETTTNDMRDVDAACAMVRKARQEADVVIVSFHGGAEGPAAQHLPSGKELFWGEDRGDVRAFAHGVIDAGADLVLGHGPHVVRALELRRGRLIAYSLGNFATYGAINLNGPMGVSMILTVRLRSDGAFVGGKIHPVVQHSPGGPKLDAKLGVLELLRDLSRDVGDAAPVISAEGALGSK